MLGRRHVARQLEELDRRVGGTSVAGGQCRSAKRGRNGFVGSIGSKRKMPRALLGVGNALCQLAVNVPAAADGCGRVDGCCEQWVGKEHAAPFVDPDDACSLGFCHADRIEQAECRLRERRRQEERVSRCRGQPTESTGDELGEVARHRKWRRPAHGLAMLEKCAGELEREERVAGRGPFDAKQRWSCERAAELGLQDLVKRGEVERAEPNATCHRVPGARPTPARSRRVRPR